MGKPKRQCREAGGWAGEGPPGSWGGGLGSEEEGEVPVIRQGLYPVSLMQPGANLFFFENFQTYGKVMKNSILNISHTPLHKWNNY